MTSTTQRDVIVVGVDGTDASSAALAWAVARAERYGASITLVSSYPNLDDVPLRGYLALEPSLIEDSERWLTAAVEQVAATGWSGPDPERVVSSRTPEDLIAAESKDAALVVIGQRGHSTLDLHLGSNAHRIVEASRAPVVVVPTDWRFSQAKLIVLAVEPGRDTDKAATAFAFDAAAQTGSSLEVQTVCRPLSITAPGQFYRELEDQLVEDTRLAQAEAVAGWREQYPDVQVERVVSLGHPVKTLTERSERARMVVLGGDMHRGMLTRVGSVSRGVLQRATCPVAIVRAG